MVKTTGMFCVIAILLSVAFQSSLYASEIDKDSSSIYLQQALLQKKNNNPVEVGKLFQKAIDFDSLNLPTRIEYVNFLLENMKHFSAVEQLQKILLIDPANFQAHSKLVEVSFQLNRWKDVIHYGTKINSRNHLAIKYMIGKAYYEEEDYGLAKINLADAVLNDAKNKLAVILLGKVHIELGEYHEAINVYKQALLLDENNAYLIYEFGLLYYTINKEREAVKYFELAVEKGYKADLDYTENLGLAYLSFDLVRGVEILNTVLQKKPKNRDILMEIAHAYFRKKQFQSAADVYQKVYQHDPANHKALYMTGLSYIRKGDKIKGNGICEKAIRLDPTLSEFRRLSFLN